jgi:ABC-type multidrug transport system fused ATPase/permease subunit
MRQKCIVEGLAGKTVILVTHQIEFLHTANLILVMRDGSIVQSGQFEELLSAGLDFESLVDAHNESLDKVANSIGEPPSVESSEPVFTTQTSRSLSGRGALNVLEKSPSSRSLQSASGHMNWMHMEGRLSRSASTNADMTTDLRDHDGNSTKLIEEEERSTGHVSLGVYWLYLTAAFGGAIALAVVVIQCVWQALLVSGDYWVAHQTGLQHFNPYRFISVYSILAFACAFCVLARAILIAFMSLTTSQGFYLRMLRSLFRAPMSFFDTTPLGRILSRVGHLLQYRVVHFTLACFFRANCQPWQQQPCQRLLIKFFLRKPHASNVSVTFLFTHLSLSMWLLPLL